MRRADCFLFELGEGKLRGSIDRDEEIELALFGSNFGDVDVEGADRVVGEALRLGLSPSICIARRTASVVVALP